MTEAFYGTSVANQLRVEGGQSPAPIPATAQIVIRKVLNGYIVECGCQWVVFENKDKMLKELSRYYDNPAKVEEEYLKKGGCK